MPQLALTAKEIHILVQLIAAMMENDVAFDYAKKSELNSICFVGMIVCLIYGVSP